MREQGVGIGADGVEGDVAEIEQAGEADHDVQPPAEHDVDQDGGRRCRRRSGWRTAGTAATIANTRPAGREPRQDCRAAMRAAAEPRDRPRPGAAQDDQPAAQRQRTSAAPARRQRTAMRRRPGTPRRSAKLPASGPVGPLAVPQAAEADRRQRATKVDELLVELSALPIRGAEPTMTGRARRDQRGQAASLQLVQRGHRLRPSRSRACRAGRSGGRSGPRPGCRRPPRPCTRS